MCVTSGRRKQTHGRSRDAHRAFDHGSCPPDGTSRKMCSDVSRAQLSTHPASPRCSSVPVGALALSFILDVLLTPKLQRKSSTSSGNWALPLLQSCFCFLSRPQKRAEPSKTLCLGPSSRSLPSRKTQNCFEREGRSLFPGANLA